MQIGKKKMALDHVMIEQMDAADDAGIDVESILRHGTDALFKDDDTQDIKYDSASVDRLLDRSQIENTQTANDNSAESQFSFARVWANNKGTLEEGLGVSDDAEPDPSIWDAILKEREREAAQEAAAREEDLGRGRRKRQVSPLLHEVNVLVLLLLRTLIMPSIPHRPLGKRSLEREPRRPTATRISWSMIVTRTKPKVRKTMPKQLISMIFQR